MATPSLPMCSIAGLGARELTLADTALLQSFFEANPDCFPIVDGKPAGPGKAHEELLGELPDGWSFSHCNGQAEPYRGHLGQTAE